MTAPPPTPTPKFVYKIYPNTKSFEIPTPYPSDFTFPQDQLDQSSGYFHMSSKDQLPGTLGFFFDSHKIVQILKIDYVKLSAAKTVKWELGDDGKAYPHLYALLSGEFVVEVKVVDKGTSWSETATTLEKEDIKEEIGRHLPILVPESDLPSGSLRFIYKNAMI